MTALVSGDLESLALVHKALGDIARLRILRLLPRDTSDCNALYNVNELGEELGIPQPTVSHHLKILKHAGLIRYVKKCSSVYYHLDVERLQQAWRQLNGDVLRMG
jgi:ArsR family transcriptional regulator